MMKISLTQLLFISFLTAPVTLVSQNVKADGYKGIWYSNGQYQEYGYKFSGGVTTFAPRHKPIAIFSPEARKTFFVFGGTTGRDEKHLLIMIAYFDHKTHLVPRPVIVYDKMGVSEPHDNASLAIDNNGFLWVFISGRSRTRPGLIFKSTEPYSIDKFEKIAETEIISPQPWWIEEKGFLLMFSKATKGLELYYSTGEKAWTDSKKITEMGGNMQISEVVSQKLVTVFNYLPEGNRDKRTNLYLLQTEDMGKTWKTVDGKIITIPISDTYNKALIKDYEAEGKLVYINDLNFDKNGNPVILVILTRNVNPGPESGPREWMVISWNNQKWNFNKVCESTHNYDMGSLYISDEEWRIIGPTESGAQKYGTGGEIALWISRNEGTDWTKVKNLTENSINNNSFVRRPDNVNKEFYALWTDGNTDTISPSHLYFTNEKCNRIWILPYEMTKERQKPMRIK
jgi:hypothetical protein